eukprot:12748442-Alexandrium_andersonii.AAC.1
MPSSSAAPKSAAPKSTSPASPPIKHYKLDRNIKGYYVELEPKEPWVEDSNVPTSGPHSPRSPRPPHALPKPFNKKIPSKAEMESVNAATLAPLRSSTQSSQASASTSASPPAAS